MTIDVLVVLHDASRTGSPRVMLELVDHLRATGASVVVRSLVPGPLAAAFSDGADDTSDGAGRTHDVIVVNGSLAAQHLLGTPADLPALVYVHEDEEALALLTPDARLALTRRADHVVCASPAAAVGLVELGVPAAKVSVLRPATPTVPAPTRRLVDDARASTLTAPGDRLVVGCGEAAWHKGPDLFLDVARRLADDPALRFAWIGRRQRSLGRMLDHDTRRLGLTERMTWLGELADPSGVLALAQVLVMPSRRDAQPLAPLEAAQLGTPTVGFAVGGLADLASEAGAAVVPYPDTVGLADAVRRVLQSPTVANDLVDAACDHWRRERSIEVVGPQFADLLTSLVTS